MRDFGGGLVFPEYPYEPYGPEDESPFDRCTGCGRDERWCECAPLLSLEGSRSGVDAGE